MSTTQPIKDTEKLIRFREYYQHEDHNPRNHALIVLGLNSALRISDILELRWQDIYNNDCYRPHVTITEKKTGKVNQVMLNESAKTALETLRLSLKKYDVKHYIFSSQKYPYKNICRSQAFRIIKKAAVFCGLDEHISCHSLRKTFGYYAWKQGVQPALLMSIYNHSSYEITKRYLCIDQIEKDEVYQKILL